MKLRTPPVALGSDLALVRSWLGENSTGRDICKLFLVSPSFVQMALSSRSEKPLQSTTAYVVADFKRWYFAATDADKRALLESVKLAMHQGGAVPLAVFLAGIYGAEPAVLGRLAGAVVAPPLASTPAVVTPEAKAKGKPKAARKPAAKSRPKVKAKTKKKPAAKTKATKKAA